MPGLMTFSATCRFTGRSCSARYTDSHAPFAKYAQELVSADLSPRLLQKHLGGESSAGPARRPWDSATPRTRAGRDLQGGGTEYRVVLFHVFLQTGPSCLFGGSRYGYIRSKILFPAFFPQEFEHFAQILPSAASPERTVLAYVLGQYGLELPLDRAEHIRGLDLTFDCVSFTQLRQRRGFESFQTGSQQAVFKETPVGLLAAPEVPLLQLGQGPFQQIGLPRIVKALFRLQLVYLVWQHR